MQDNKTQATVEAEEDKTAIAIYLNSEAAEDLVPASAKTGESSVIAASTNRHKEQQLTISNNQNYVDMDATTPQLLSSVSPDHYHHKDSNKN